MSVIIVLKEYQLDKIILLSKLQIVFYYEG